jgi:hypothetical protein
MVWAAGIAPKAGLLAVRPVPARARSPLLQLDRLAVSEEMDAGAWCHACDLPGECLSRQINQLGPLTKAGGPPGTPVHRDGTIWVSAADHVGCLLRVEMALIKRRSPASNWHQGNVDVHHLVERNVRTRVPRIPAPARALDEIAERGSTMRTPRESPAVVIGGQDAYLQAAKLHEVTSHHLPELHASGSDWPEQTARTHWGDENCGGRDESERRQVGVVGVQVGDQDKIR